MVLYRPINSLLQEFYLLINYRFIVAIGSYVLIVLLLLFINQNIGLSSNFI
jgi:hypothetical protein